MFSMISNLLCSCNISNVSFSLSYGRISAFPPTLLEICTSFFHRLSFALNLENRYKIANFKLLQKISDIFSEFEIWNSNFFISRKPYYKLIQMEKMIFFWGINWESPVLLTCWLLLPKLHISLFLKKYVMICIQWMDDIPSIYLGVDPIPNWSVFVLSKWP